MLVIVTSTAFWFSLNPLPKRPNIAIYTNLPTNRVYTNAYTHYDFKLYIHNGGNAPCFDLKLHTSTKVINADIVMDDVGLFDSDYAYIPVLKVEGLNDDTAYFGYGMIKEGEVKTVAITLSSSARAQTKKQKINFEIVCSGDKASKEFLIIPGSPKDINSYI